MKNTLLVVTGLVGASIAASASAQDLITYYWEINDTGSNTATIGPGETVTLKMYATWEPYEYTFAHCQFEILGMENWETGEVTFYENKIDDLASGPGELQSNNDILGIESFSHSPFFGGRAFHPPAHLYEIEWVPSDYTARTVRVIDSGYLENWLYDNLGQGGGVEYDPAPSEGATIYIVPAPGGVLAIVFGCLWKPRRRPDGGAG